MAIKAIVNNVEKEIIDVKMLSGGNELNAWEVRDQQNRLIWGKEGTISGQTPLTFKAGGIPLTGMTLYGNTVQNGTPTPEFVGKRTANLIKNDGVSVEYRGIKYTVNADKSITVFGTATQGVSYLIFAGDGATINSINSYSTPIFKAGETLVFSSNSQIAIRARYTNGTYSDAEFRMNAPITLTKDIGLLYIQVEPGTSVNTTVFPMVNSGSAALPYEPYGYKIPITCAGQTIPIYTGDPLRKALDGSDATDILYSTGIITREVDAEGNALATPTTQFIDSIEIPTIQGQNTLTVDTTIQPSSITINGHII